ncbi:DMT family transporter [Peptoniphilus sp. oral taxon 386]|uniref:DMT family transporter n=1 Tax=Peptoniphilus sp. oral taxon 386 TaxID=652713 RepID=UPI0001DAA062|nr:DMT family transporter [Peptoniphilus sp. oral taxon 386]EFI41645.1 putative membrane protein [Peptoniphilus sp. oral taxon 386 str. F0131]
MKSKFVSSILLIFSAAIWGFAFVAQSTGMEHIGPFTFSALRSIIGSIAMILTINVIPKIGMLQKKETSVVVDKALTRRAGIINGIILFFAMNSQQYGLLYTTPGKAGFITALYIVIIPIMRSFMGEKVSLKVIICVIFATFGMYLLSVKENFTVNFGDIVVFCSAIFYSIHTLTLAHYSPKVDSIKLNAFQFLLSGILSLICALIFETFSLQDIVNSMGSILYVAIMSTAIAYSLQIVALKVLEPTIASLLNSSESIFAVLGGFLILNQHLTHRELIGCLIMFVSTLIAQIPIMSFRRKYE